MRDTPPRGDPGRADAAHAGAAPFNRPGWVFEEKVDGWRTVAYKDGARLLVSRNGVDHTTTFADIATAISKLSSRTLVLDGDFYSGQQTRFWSCLDTAFEPVFPRRRRALLAANQEVAPC